MKRTQKLAILPVLAALAGMGGGVIRADEVIDWNQNMLKAIFIADISPPAASRVAAIVHASVFDAVNGIERRYTAVQVQPGAPSGASVRAAAVQAAYASLVELFPDQKSVFDSERAASLAGISSGAAAEHSRSIARGLAWGQTVADAILLWRSTDGFTSVFPPFTGGTAVGQWRPTPPGFAPGGAVPFAHMTPWIMKSPSQFRPGGPPALDGDQYAADFNETRLWGSSSSVLRTPDETIACHFWHSSTWTYFWNHIAVSIASERHTTLSENARLLALLNISLADAAIACFDAKYNYVFWRPITAIPLGDIDGNPATTADPSWTPLFDTPEFGTPNHPEYPSAHSTVSGAAAETLTAYFGDETSFTTDTDYPPMAGVTRSFTSFSGSLEEIKNARVFAGIHFRSACDDGRDTGIAVADYVMAHSLRPLHGHHDGNRGHQDGDHGNKNGDHGHYNGDHGH